MNGLIAIFQFKSVLESVYVPFHVLNELLGRANLPPRFNEDIESFPLDDEKEYHYKLLQIN